MVQNRRHGFEVRPEVFRTERDVPETDFLAELRQPGAAAAAVQVSRGPRPAAGGRKDLARRLLPGFFDARFGLFIREIQTEPLE